MAVAADGEALGSISGGCVEAAVHDAALRVLETGVPERCIFGVAAEHAFAAGLTCGGEIEVYVEPVAAQADHALDEIFAALAAGRPVAVETVLEPTPRRRLLDAGPVATDVAVLEEDGGTARLVQVFAAPPRMIVFGAIDFADAVARMGSFLGYRVTVCDARPVFATPARFPSADEVVVDWPHRYLAGQRIEPSTVLCVLTHDAKFDVPLLEVALRTDAGFIGVMGNRRTHGDRIDRLRARGVEEGALARLRAPVGLDLGASTPAETAVSIAAEILAARHGRSGLPLRDLDAPIHDVARSALLCEA